MRLRNRYSSLAWISGWAGSGGSFLFPHQQRKLLYLFFSRRMEKLPALTLHRSCAGYAGTSGLSGEFWFFSAGLLGWLLGLGVLFSVPAQWTHTNIPGACRGAFAAVPCWFWLGLSPGAPLPHGWGFRYSGWISHTHCSYLCWHFLLPQWLREISVSTWEGVAAHQQDWTSRSNPNFPTQTFQPKPTLGVCDSMKFGFLHFFSGVF